MESVGQEEMIGGEPAGADDMRAASPFGASWRKMMMWLFLVSDALTFAAFLIAYGMLRMTSAAWPDQTAVFDMRLITFMTFVLISSSAVMAMAVGAAREGNPKTAIKFVGLTVLGGLIFLGSQAYEWAHFIGEGASPWTNPWGPAAFGAGFFLITGFHGVHVLSGVILLAVTAIRASAGRYTGEGVEVVGLYWHFVDIVWVFVFAFFYLL
jgi:cytochrome c oxidase subunit 3